MSVWGKKGNRNLATLKHTRQNHHIDAMVLSLKCFLSLFFNIVQTSTTNQCKFLCFTVFLLTAADENEFRLIRDVMSRYDKRIRPSVNHTLPTTINFSVALAQIIDVVKFYLMHKLQQKKRTFPPIFVILFLHCLF